MDRTTDLSFRVDEAGVGVVTLQRPEVLNAFRKVTIAEFAGVLDHAAANPDLRALVITGTGRAFSAGQDLTELAEQLNELATDPGRGRAAVEALQDLTRKLLALDI